MKRTLLGIIASVVALVASASAYAAPYGMAGCGIGALILEDKPGKIQILAATLNNIISPQTSAITSGTSGCYESDRETASLFITVNQAALAKDISRGSGETIEGLAQVLKCDDSAKLGESLRRNYGQIFPSANISAEEVNRSIEQTVQGDSELAANCKLFG